MLKVTLQWCSIYSGDQPHFCELIVCSDLSMNNNRIEYFQLLYKTAFRPYFRAADMYRTLLPRMKQSPYLALSCPSTYSSVCSIAMFMYPSRQARTPAHYILCQLSIIGCGMPKLRIHWVRGNISTIETFLKFL